MGFFVDGSPADGSSSSENGRFDGPEVEAVDGLAVALAGGIFCWLYEITFCPLASVTVVVTV